MEVEDIADLTEEKEDEIIWCKEAINLNNKNPLTVIPIKTNSNVWRYFRLLDSDNMICVKCAKSFKFVKSSISTYKYHISNVHKIENSDVSCDRTKRKRGLNEYFAKIDQSSLDDIVYRWLTNNNVSSTVLDHPELQELLDVFKYKLPTRVAYNKYLDSMAIKSINRIKDEIIGSEISLTADGWKSAANVSFIGITTRIVTEDFDVHYYWNYLKEIYPSTSENIIKHIVEMELSYDIKRVINVTTDGAPNMIGAVREHLGLCGIKCFAHSCKLLNKT